MEPTGQRLSLIFRMDFSYWLSRKREATHEKYPKLVRTKTSLGYSSNKLLMNTYPNSNRTSENVPLILPHSHLLHRIIQ